MTDQPEVRRYRRFECVVFRRTRQPFGRLSNMAAGFPLVVNGARVLTSEALYQACRFPTRPEVQRLIVEQTNPMTAKLKGRQFIQETRPDWDRVRLAIMGWCLRVKLAQHRETFGGLLLASGERPIVEESRRDDFWGAKPIDNETLLGVNALGRLLMELREQLRSDPDQVASVEPLDLPDFLLFGEPIGRVEAAPGRSAPASTLPLVAERAPVARVPSPRDQSLPPSTSGNSPGLPPAARPTDPLTDSLRKAHPDMQLSKKLIEVALPLDAINQASAREKSIRHGHPSTLHLWWARRPLAAARAVIFAQMVDDPSAHPELFPTEQAQEAERQRLFRLLEALVQWENTTNEALLAQAREEIWKSWRLTCAANQDHPRAAELFDPNRLPAFHDPFCGGGSLPLEAQRLGLEAYASDLNPVAVLITKAMIEIPPRFAGRPPVNPEARREPSLIGKQWRGAQGLAEDVRYYGRWMRDEAEKRIGHLYPKVEITPEMAAERPDLRPLVGRKLTVIAWLWARTVKSPNPAFAQVDVPLASTFLLSTKPGKEAYVEPVIGHGGYRFTVKVGKPRDPEATKSGTKLGRGAHFRCLMSGAPIAPDYIKAAGRAGRMGARLMGIVAEGERGRIYLPPSEDMELLACQAKSEWAPDIEISGSTQYLGVKPYGMDQFSRLFTARQIAVLTTFAALVREVHQQVAQDAVAAQRSVYSESIANTGSATAYADAVSAYMALAVDKVSDYGSTLVVWSPTRDQAKTTFVRQALAMVWDFAEVNVFARAAGDISVSIEGIAQVLMQLNLNQNGHAFQSNAQTQSQSIHKIISTDPPYYDNVPYADLSDYFYIWLRRSMILIKRDLFATLTVPKSEELVAFAYRHEDKESAGHFFMEGMTRAMHRLSDQAHSAFPVTIYYAFKQAETESDGTASTGWETFIDAVLQSGFGIGGTWPLSTERAVRNRGIDSNALASSIVLVCRPRPADAPVTTRREFLSALKAELPAALAHLQRSNIAPVDLAQAAIGPGMAIYTRYARVLDAEGNELKVRQALALINQVLDETLAEQEGDFDADTRWALAWFDQLGFAEGEYGLAETLSKAKNTSVAGMMAAGLLRSRGGRVRLLRPAELPDGWDPSADARLTVWEIVHQLIRAQDSGGEAAAAELLAKLGGRAEVARELAYRLYTLCERKKRAPEALAYNGLVQSWPEFGRLAQQQAQAAPRQGLLL